MAALAVHSGAGERVVTRVLQDAARAYPDRAAVSFEAAEYTFAELWSRGRRAARVLRDTGVRPGDAVLVMQENTIQFVDAWLGIALLGAVQVPVNTEYRGKILHHQVRNSAARLMLLEIAEHDLVAIMYTSGTTGPSKGVRVTHAHAYTYANLAAQALELTEGDVYYAPLPLFHIAGQWALVYACLQVGATAIVRRRFSVSDFWAVVKESGATASFLLGAMANFLARQQPKPDDLDNPLERMLMVPLVDALDDFRRRFGVRICTCYGSTEVNVPIISDYDVIEPDIAGRPVAGF